MNEDTIVSAGDLLKSYTPIPQKKRGDYFKEWSIKTGYSIPFIAAKLKGMHDLETIRYIDSVCRQESARGRSWKHCFDIEIKKIWNSAHTT